MTEYITEYNPGANVGEYAYKRKAEVVRCKDCFYYEKDPDPIDPGWPMMCALTGMSMIEPFGFCAWGERHR